MDQEGIPVSESNAELKVVTLAQIQHACSHCNMRELCLPHGLSVEDLDRLDEMVSTRKKVKRGESIFHGGEPFSALYAVRVGFFKTRLVSIDGHDQVTGFFMGGELLGMDGISTEKHTCTATALEDSEVCVIPFTRLEELSRSFEPLQRHFHKVMSREIVRDQGVMLLLGSMRAEERLAAFLLNLSQRLTSRGYSPSEFVLRMTREDIGSYLGMKLETVSRLFSRFQEGGLITVQQKNVRIVDIGGLRAMLSPAA